MGKPHFVSMNGRIIPFEDARIHVLTPAAKYGATVFEGLCGYWNASDETMHIFRLSDHLVRLVASARITRMAATFSESAYTQMVLDTLSANQFASDVHIRLSVWVDGDGAMHSAGPIGVMCAALPRSERTLESMSASATVSSWRRIDDSSMPPRVKSASNYNNGRLAQMQAKLDGYDEALLLNALGKVAEGAAACFFMVRGGQVATPTVTDGILESVTRATLITLLQEMGVTVIERPIDRTELYAADEAFLCGSSYEITPLTSIDRHRIGRGRIGDITRTLWSRYDEVVRGMVPYHPDWRLEVPRQRGEGLAAAS